MREKERRGAGAETCLQEDLFLKMEAFDKNKLMFPPPLHLETRTQSLTHQIKLLEAPQKPVIGAH